MVKGGSAKNNRRKSSGKVTRRVKNTTRFASAQFSNEAIKANWDDKLTVNQNYRKLGLVSDANPRREQLTVKSVTSKIELFDVPDSDDLRNPKRRPMSDEEQKYLNKLIKKHGDNYEAMARDIKVNVKQLTEAHLKRRCARFSLLNTTERCAEVM